MATTFYAIKNDKGEYYRTYTRHHDNGWVKDLRQARVWTTRAPALNKITVLSKDKKCKSLPFLVELFVSEINVIAHDSDCNCKSCVGM